MPDLGAFYTDEGVLPRAEFLPIAADQSAVAFPLAFMSGALWSQVALFAAAAVAAAALLLGYRTRLSTFVCWVLLSAIQLRNPFVVFGAGVFLRMLLFWSMFLPLGAHFSLDRRWFQPVESPAQKSVFSVATCGLEVQIAIVFLVAGLAKWVHPMWRQGSGVAYALDYEPIATQLGMVLAQFPALCAVVSYAVIAIELGGTALLFSPVLASVLRPAALFAMTGMLAGFALTMRIGSFPLVTFAALLAFLPASLWDRVVALIPAASRPAASEVGRRGSRRQRTGYGRGSMLLVRARDALAAVVLVFVVVWNIGLWYDADYRPPAPLSWIKEPFHLRQRWGMFTRLPSTGWLSMPGTLGDGSSVELFSAGGPLPDYEEAIATTARDRPPLVSATFKSVPWEIFFLNITENPEGAWDQLRSYGRYLCRQWNAREPGPRQLMTFEVIYSRRPVAPQPPGGVDRQYQRQVIWQHRCFG